MGHVLTLKRDGYSDFPAVNLILNHFIFRLIFPVDLFISLDLLSCSILAVEARETLQES